MQNNQLKESSGNLGWYFTKLKTPAAILMLVMTCSYSYSTGSIDHELKVCSGKPGGTYIKAAYWIANQMRPYFKKVTVVPSSGSLESHVKMALGECDLALAQGDSLPYFENKTSELATQFSDGRPQAIRESDLENHSPVSLTHKLLESKIGLYLESVHLMCNRELGANFEYSPGALSRNRKGINSMEDLIAYLEDIEDKGERPGSPKPIIYLGPSGGGAHATYFAIQFIHPEFKNAIPRPIDESGGINNGVAAGLLKLFQQPQACFLYVSRPPHKIIKMLDAMGGDNGPANRKDLRLDTQAMDGTPVKRFYFEAVKLLDSTTKTLLKAKDPKGANLFTENKVDTEYANLRIPDESLDFTRGTYYSNDARSKTMLATPTQVYARDEFFSNIIDSDDQIRSTFKRIIQEAQIKNGNFPEE